MVDFPTYKEFVRQAAMAKISEMLEECTEEQRAFYARLFPTGPSPDQLASAFDLVHRTLVKNAKESTP